MSSPGAGFVLLHSPFLGPSTWTAVAAELDRQGHAPVVIDYRPALGRSRAYYASVSQFVAGAISPRSVLVVHSAAGGLVPAIREAAGEKICGAVFVDALLPYPQRCWMDTAPEPLRTLIREGGRDGHAPPWPSLVPERVLSKLLPASTIRARVADECLSLPLEHLLEPAPGGDLPDDFSAAYLQLSGAYDAEASLAADRGWPVSRLGGADHLWPITHPAEVAQAVLEGAARLRLF